MRRVRDPATRGHLTEHLCGDDPALRGRVKAILAETSGGAFIHPVIGEEAVVQRSADCDALTGLRNLEASANQCRPQRGRLRAMTDSADNL
jgi:hypothetical protein